RLDRKIEIPLPNEQGRFEILKIHAQNIQKQGEIDYEAIVKLSDSFNGADLRNVITEAGFFAIRDDRDYIIQNDLMKAVRKVAEAKLDFFIIVLGTGFWPLQPPSTPFNLPKELTNIYEKFQSFYQKKHNGRKLNWLFQLSKGELKANYLPDIQITYTFQVSTYQMGILLAYNTSTSFSYEQLQVITALNKDILDASLNILVKAKVLLLFPPNMTIGDSSTRYYLNMDFKSKKTRINLNIPTKIEQKQEIDETHKTIEEDRKLLMQVGQIKSRFIPKISDIKRCIDALIEKEYLERTGKDEYSYLA
ncbi:hypothetical protein PCK1_002584, partial [Pneumocystis canis]